MMPSLLSHCSSTRPFYSLGVAHVHREGPKHRQGGEREGTHPPPPRARRGDHWLPHGHGSRQLGGENNIKLIQFNEIFTLEGIEWKYEHLHTETDKKLTPSHCVASRYTFLHPRTSSAILQHPNRKVSHLMTPIFDLLATVTQRLTTIGSGTGADGAGEAGEGSWLLPLLRRLLSQPANRRGCYPALLGLLPRVGATAVLEQRPRFIQDLFGAFSSMENVGSACAQLLLALLGRLRDELAGDDATTPGTGATGATGAAEAAEKGTKKGKGKGRGKGKGKGKGGKGQG